MSTDRRTKARNVPTLLLDDWENQQLFSIFSKGSVSLASGVVQLYLADPPTPKKWNKRTCGIACFIKDNSRRSYYISVYDVDNKKCIWEQELYQGFRYKTPREYFHTFETDAGQAALNFASEDEADKFKAAVEAKLEERHKQKIEKKRRTQINDISNNTAPPVVRNRSLPPTPSPESVPPKEPLPRKASVSSVKEGKEGKDAKDTKESKKHKKEKEKKDKKRKLTKLDIGAPEDDFRIVSHVGWDPVKGLNMSDLDPDMQALLSQVGITNTQDVDKDTFDFIYDFVEKSGGLQQVKEEMKSNRELPPTPVAAPQPPTPQKPAALPIVPEAHGKVPPPPPARHGSTHLINIQPTSPPPPIPSRVTSNNTRAEYPPAPPPTSAKHSQKPMPPPPAARPPNRQRSSGTGYSPPPPPMENSDDLPLPPPPAELLQDVPPPRVAPHHNHAQTPLPPAPVVAPMAPAPPPAPVPPPAAPAPPPAPSVSAQAPVVGGRGGLLSEIQSGTKLHKVTPNENRPNPGGERGNLLDQIKQGAVLKKVEQDARPAAAAQPTTGIAGALFKALSERQKAIRGSDGESESDDDGFDDDEWDDD